MGVRTQGEPRKPLRTPKLFAAMVFKLHSVLLRLSVVVELGQRRVDAGGTTGCLTSCLPGHEHCNFLPLKWFVPSVWTAGIQMELVFCSGIEGRPLDGVSQQQWGRGHWDLAMCDVGETHTRLCSPCMME